MHVDLFWVASSDCPIDVVDFMNATCESYDHIFHIQMKRCGDIRV